MDLIRGLHNLRSEHRGCAVTVGAFDGIHLGHQAVLRHLSSCARARDLLSTVIVFEPLPREYFRPLEAPPRITNFRERLALLASTGIDRVLVLKFNEELRGMSAEDFVSRVFVEGLGARYIALGDDFRFGNSREGDYDYVRRLAEKFNYEVQPTGTLEIADTRVSSTRIRTALAEGNFVEAQALLGRPFTMTGRVEHGRKLGRELGAPTANIRINRIRSPLSGVFAVRVDGSGLESAAAVANVGTRPTVDDGLKANLEVHLLDRECDLYGQRLEVRFLHKLREEIKYESLDALKEGIAKDIDNARHWLAQPGHS
ncbi:MAG: bifunctional riboflavin kinase/FAD synthetase [Luminiphilus sp.]|nr:bifunctional riboflavin kinase/FAD synthetase [Luminiphilus sp.]